MEEASRDPMNATQMKFCERKGRGKSGVTRRRKGSRRGRRTWSGRGRRMGYKQEEVERVRRRRWKEEEGWGIYRTRKWMRSEKSRIDGFSCFLSIYIFFDEAFLGIYFCRTICVVLEILS